MNRLVHEPDRVRDLARSILTEPPYADLEPGPLRRAFQRVLDVVGDLIGNALGTVATVPGVAWVIAGLGILLLGLVVWRATRGATLGRGRSAVIPAAASERSATEWAADADRLAAAGDLEAALRARYVATVVTLIEQGVIDDVPGRTIRELEGELSQRAPALRPGMARVGERVEAVVFGDQPAREGDLELAASALRAAGLHRPRVEVGGRA